MRRTRTADAARVIAHVNALKLGGCEIAIDMVAGTAEARDGEDRPFFAVRKVRDGPWFCVFTDTDNVKWAWDETGE